MHPGLDLGVGSSPEYKYSVTQSQTGYYRHNKWWHSAPISRSDPKQKDESENIWVAHI